jgi:hypothetical protein
MMNDKKHSYAKYVKEIHWPEVSQKKQEELEHLKLNLKHPVRKPRNLYEINKQDDTYSQSSRGPNK